MGKSKKKAMHSQKEEQQAKKVMMTMGVIAIVLVLLTQLSTHLLITFYWFSVYYTSYKQYQQVMRYFYVDTVVL